MKILIVMGGFFPGKEYGGPPVSVDNFCSLLNEFECFIVTHNHDKSDNTEYKGIESCTWVERDNCSVMYLPDSKYSKQEFERIILSINPDIIYLQGLFQQCILPCLQLAKKHKKPVLLAPRGELCAGAFKKKYKKIPYVWFLRMSGLISNVSFQSTSDEETEGIMKYLGIEKDRIHFMTNIPSIPKDRNISVNKVEGKANLIFISRIVPKKNLLSALNYLSDVKGNLNFDIYGSLEDEMYWKECEKKIKELPSNIHVEYKGLISHDQVHETLKKYDAFLFPTLSENFGHVIAEALMVGCPVIISDQTPWTDVNDIDGGWSLPLNDSKNFVDAIQSIVDATESVEREYKDNIIQYINGKMNLSEMKDNYVNSFKSTILEKK